MKLDDIIVLSDWNLKYSNLSHFVALWFLTRSNQSTLQFKQFTFHSCIDCNNQYLVNLFFFCYLLNQFSPRSTMLNTWSCIIYLIMHRKFEKVRFYWSNQVQKMLNSILRRILYTWRNTQSHLTIRCVSYYWFMFPWCPTLNHNNNNTNKK